MFRVILKSGKAERVTTSRRNPWAIPFLLSAALVAGCASFERDHVIVGSVPTDYRTKHPIVMSQSEVHEDLVVSNSMKSMSFRQHNVVQAFAARFKKANAKTLRVIVPSGSANEAAARRVTRGIVDKLRKDGIGDHQIRILSYAAGGHGESATIRLSFDAVTASVASECGKWEEDLGYNPENQNYGNFGCATQNNLAQMIANPEDLLGPRGESEIDAGRRNTIINGWRTEGTPALPALLQ